MMTMEHKLETEKAVGTVVSNIVEVEDTIFALAKQGSFYQLSVHVSNIIEQVKQLETNSDTQSATQCVLIGFANVLCVPVEYRELWLSRETRYSSPLDYRIAWLVSYYGEPVIEEYVRQVYGNGQGE